MWTWTDSALNHAIASSRISGGTDQQALGGLLCACVCPVIGYASTLETKPLCYLIPKEAGPHTHREGEGAERRRCFIMSHVKLRLNLQALMARHAHVCVRGIK